jgi:GNAT superfamily N-acetyltransferase
MIGERMSNDEFLKKFRDYYRSGALDRGVFAYWKLRDLIGESDAYRIPESDAFYLIRGGHLLFYHSPDGVCQLPAESLNALDCICLTAAMYDSLKDRLKGFEAGYAWNLEYDFGYVLPPREGLPLYDAVDFDFHNPLHFAAAAQIIATDGWFTESNVRKMMRYSAFDPSLWFFVREISSGELCAVSISTYCAEVRETDLDWIFVAPSYQGRGVSRFLIEETIRRCAYKSDSIRVGGAVDFYRRCGFKNLERWAWAKKPGYEFKAPLIQP